MKTREDGVQEARTQGLRRGRQRRQADTRGLGRDVARVSVWALPVMKLRGDLTHGIQTLGNSPRVIKAPAASKAVECEGRCAPRRPMSKRPVLEKEPLRPQNEPPAVYRGL